MKETPYIFDLLWVNTSKNTNIDSSNLEIDKKVIPISGPYMG